MPHRRELLRPKVCASEVWGTDTHGDGHARRLVRLATGSPLQTAWPGAGAHRISRNFLHLSLRAGGPSFEVE